jgi:hypothetical protein
MTDEWPLRDSESDDAEVSLQKALTRFGNPELVRRWEAAQGEELPPSPRKPVSWLRGDADPYDVLRAKGDAYHVSRKRNEILARIRAAEEPLVRDFRDRVASGEIVLTGLQTKPSMGRKRTTLPAIWAPLLRFVWRKDMVCIGPEEFSFVRAAGPLRRAATVQGAVGPAATEPEGGPKATTPGMAPRGPRSTVPLIERAVRENWSKIRSGTPADGAEGPNWHAAAILLEKWMRRRSPKGEDQKLPAVRTIRKHLPDVYARLLAEKAGRI